MSPSPHAHRIATLGRSAEAIRGHYDIEKILAARLRGGSREERLSLYRTVYDDLFRLLSDHPQLVRKQSPEQTRHKISAQLGLLGPYLRRDAVFLELGAGDCALSLEIAKRVKQVFAVDVSEQITAGVQSPDNLTVVICDGCTIPLPPNTVDMVYSNQLIEHVHPDDLVQQLGSVRSVLRPNGTYLCVTPNRLNGPHDISKYFDDEATGLHIKEYTNAEVQALFLAEGFFRLLRLCGRRGPVSEIARVAACHDRDDPAALSHLDKKIHRETSALHRPPRGSDGRTRLNQNGRAALSRSYIGSAAGISRPEGEMGDA